MQNKRMENSVKSLTNLYTVVIGISLTYAISRVVDVNAGLDSITLSPVALFVAFAATLFPFFHGAMRHLYDTYIHASAERETAEPQPKSAALIVDFVLLFFHALALILLSLLLKNPGHFAWVLSVVLAIDVAWGVFVNFSSSKKTAGLSAESRWAIINFVFVFVVISFLVTQDIYLGELSTPWKVSVPLCLACLLRTLVDYVWCREFYFPNN
jgi:hypothetical protein